MTEAPDIFFFVIQKCEVLDCFDLLVFVGRHWRWELVVKTVGTGL